MSHINTPLFQLDVKRQCLFCYGWILFFSFATIPFQCQSLVPVCLRTGSPTRSYFRCVSSDLLTIIFGFVIILATSQFPINNRPSWPNCWRLDDRVLSAIHCRSENDARAKVTSCPETRPGRRDLRPRWIFLCLFFTVLSVRFLWRATSRQRRQYQCQSVCPDDGMSTCHRTSVAWLLWAWNKRKEVLVQVARALNLLHTALANLFFITFDIF